MSSPLSISREIANSTFNERQHPAAHDFKTTINLTDLDLFTKGQPLKEFKEMRDQAPVFWHPPMVGDIEPGFWSLTNHADILKVSSDPSTFSSQMGTGTMMTLGREDRRHPKLWRSAIDHMLNLDGSFHLDLRKEHMPFFKPNFISELQSKVSIKVTQLLDEAEKLNEFNLNLCSGWYGANLRTNSVNEEKNLIQEQLKLFKDCNSPCMVFAEVSGSIQGDPNRKLSTRPQMDLEESKKYYEKISEMGKYLEDEGMPLAYHHHMGTVIETEEDTVRLLENTHDSVKLTLDTGHMLFAQGESLKILNDFSERLIHMHCKDIRKSVLEKSLKEDLSFRGAFLEGAFTVPGDGCIDYKPLFDVLKEKNYSGWLVVEAEQDPSKANPFEYAKIGYKYLTGTLKKSNLEVFQN